MVTLADLSVFLNTLISSYDHYIFYAFTLMMSSHLLVLIRRLFVGVRQ